MKQLYCPWRRDYSLNTARSKNEDATQEECVFCQNLKQEQDEKNFIIKRFDHNAVMLNRFPYNAGHLLVLPYPHVSDLNDLSAEARQELIELTTQSAAVLKKVLGAQGINIGLNMGKAGGAGMPAHVHMHVLPRWQGDTNFLPTLAQTKTISFDLHDIYQKLKKAF